MASTIMIFLPGITGSTLVSDKNDYDTGTPVWPAQVQNNVLDADIASSVGDASLASTDLDSALTDLRNTDLFPGVPSNGYTVFFNYFEGQGFQYHDYSDPAGVATPPPQNLLLGLAYDWRQDNSTSAQYLQGALQMIDTAYKESGDYQVFLVAHSMGGLVSRAYLENATYANDPWRPNVKALITLGTPHLGAPLAVFAIQGRLNLVIPAVTLDFETVIENFVDQSFSDSTYELLPPPSVPFIQYDGQSYSIFDPDLPAVVKSQINDLSFVDLDSAKDFFASLTNTNNLPPYYCIYGLSPSHLTSVGVAYTDTEGLVYEFSLQGDQIVPASSASFAGQTVADRYNPPGDVTHFQLPGDPNVQQQVAQWMGLSVAAVGASA